MEKQADPNFCYIYVNTAFKKNDPGKNDWRRISEASSEILDIYTSLNINRYEKPRDLQKLHFKKCTNSG